MNADRSTLPETYSSSLWPDSVLAYGVNYSDVRVNMHNSIAAIDVVCYSHISIDWVFALPCLGKFNIVWRSTSEAHPEVPGL